MLPRQNSYSKDDLIFGLDPTTERFKEHYSNDQKLIMKFNQNNFDQI